MNYLIDTNIISEVRKGRRCDPNVARWYEKIEDASLYLSVLVIGEIRNGIEKVRPKDTAKANALEQWLIAHHFVMLRGHKFEGRHDNGRLQYFSRCPTRAKASVRNGQIVRTILPRTLRLAISFRATAAWPKGNVRLICGLKLPSAYHRRSS